MTIQSRHPLWEDIAPIDSMARRREDFRSDNVFNSTVAENLAIRQQGFLLPRHLRYLLNRFRIDQGTCKACLKKMGSAKYSLCDCDEPHTMSHKIDSCPNTSLTGGISALHKADNICIDWLATYIICIR